MQTPEILHGGVQKIPIAVNLLIFILSVFLGIGLIQRVSKLLHTPLMSLTNAISSVSIVAALIVMSHPENSAHPEHNVLILSLAIIAVALATTNVVSGFMITERILRMFKKDDGGKKK
jgi:H+-translocating NAD(P) transhydrogenase subunit alpha